jgi:hypothetical protein
MFMLVSGYISGSPELKTAANGKTYVEARLVEIGGHPDVDAITVRAFKDVACSILRGLADGDAVSVTGSAKLGTRQRCGVSLPTVEVVANKVASLAIPGVYRG